MIPAVLIVAIIGSISASPMSATFGRRGYYLPSFYHYDSFPFPRRFPPYTIPTPILPDQPFIRSGPKVATVDFVEANDSGVRGRVELTQVKIWIQH